MTGKIDIARLPAGALERLLIVADDTARFALTTSSVQLGDTVKVTSTGKVYMVKDESKLSSETGYEVFSSGSATSVPWSGITEKPSSYTPSAHTHPVSQITSLQALLDAKVTGVTKSGTTVTVARAAGNTTFSFGAAADKGVSDSSSASAISTGTNLVTERDVYYGLPLLNGAHTYNSSSIYYAPTSAGSTNQILKSTGGVPSFDSLTNIFNGSGATMDFGDEG